MSVMTAMTGAARAEEVDAVVVGAGPNGLVAANILADAGWAVLVLEATDEPGGAVRSAELAAPGYLDDRFSAFYPLGAGSPVIAGLGLEEYGLRWRRAPAVLSHVFPDDRQVTLWPQVERTAAAVAAFAGADGAAWEAEFAYWRRIRGDLLEAILRPFPPVRAGARLARTLGAAELLRLARMAVLPVRRLGEERFQGAGARILLAGNAMHTDLGPDQAGSAVFGWLLAMLGQDVGYPVPEGGAGRLTAALVARLAAAGGRVDCGRPVDKVLVARQRAVGVRDAGGRYVRARRAVLADVPAPSLYLDLVGADLLPDRLIADLHRFDWDDSTVKVDWALSAPVPWTAPEVASAGTVHLGADLDGLAVFSTELACGRTPRAPFLILGQSSVADQSRAPRGAASVWAYTHVPRGQRWTADRLRRLTDRIEKVVERHAPGFTELIVGRHIGGPAQLEQANPSLVDGSINAGTAAIHQQLVFRPVPGLGRADTPIDRLFLAGAAAHPGGGVHGAAGANAARAALARNGWAGPAYGALIGRIGRSLYS